MAQLLTKLKLLYPATDPKLFGLNWGEGGWFINPVNWKTADKIPTTEELAAVEAQADTLEATAEKRADQIKAMGSSDAILDAVLDYATAKTVKLDAIKQAVADAGTAFDAK